MVETLGIFINVVAAFSKLIAVFSGVYIGRKASLDQKILSQIAKISTSIMTPALILRLWDGNGVSPEDIISFVGGGGGVVAARCPWGFMQDNSGKTMRDCDINKACAAMGLLLVSGGHVSGDGNVYEKSDEAHAIGARKGKRNHIVPVCRGCV